MTKKRHASHVPSVLVPKNQHVESQQMADQPAVHNNWFDQAALLTVEAVNLSYELQQV